MKANNFQFVRAAKLPLLALLIAAGAALAPAKNALAADDNGGNVSDASVATSDTAPTAAATAPAAGAPNADAPVAPVAPADTTPLATNPVEPVAPPPATAAAATGGAASADAAAGGAPNGAAGSAAGAPFLSPTRFFAGVAPGVQLRDFSGSGVGSATLFGAGVTGGFFLAKETPFVRNLTLSADIGAYFGNANNGTGATSIETELHDYANALGGYDDWTQLDTITRRVTKSKTDYVAVPFLLTLAYNFEFGDRANNKNNGANDKDRDANDKNRERNLPKRFSVRVGPTLGITYLSAKEKRDIHNTLSGEIFDDTGASHGPATYSPDYPTTYTTHTSTSTSKALFTYGATLGAAWNATEHLSLDLQYRFQGTTKFGTAGTTTAHQFNLAAIWRF